MNDYNPPPPPPPDKSNFIKFGDELVLFLRKADIISVETHNEDDSWSTITYMCSPASHASSDVDETADDVAKKLGWV